MYLETNLLNNNRTVLELNMIWKIIGALAAGLTMFGFVPQVIKMTQTKSVHDVSILTLLQFFVGVSFWMIYGIHLRDPIIIVANTVCWMTLLVALCLYTVYTMRERSIKRTISEQPNHSHADTSQRPA